jgi:hypothetical protein
VDKGSFSSSSHALGWRSSFSSWAHFDFVLVARVFSFRLGDCWRGFFLRAFLSIKNQLISLCVSSLPVLRDDSFSHLLFVLTIFEFQEMGRRRTAELLSCCNLSTPAV